MTDLIVVVADSYQERVMEALLPRVPVSSGTRKFSFDIIKNPAHDSGSYNDSHELLRAFIHKYRFALIIFDFEGCGAEHLSREEIENNVHAHLNVSGWEGRNAVVVICPELENWMWQNNIHVQNAIGWEGAETLYDWARRVQHLKPGQNKPDRPKEALEDALRTADTSKSASIYKKIAEKVSYRGCQDISFLKLIEQLKTWFPDT